jgi:hypothetical protein
MAGGRDLKQQSPRWLNGLIWSSGLGAAAFFTWRVLFCDAEPNCVPPGLTVIAARALAVVTLPLVLAVALAARAVKWVAE